MIVQNSYTSLSPRQLSAVSDDEDTSSATTPSVTSRKPLQLAKGHCEGLTLAGIAPRIHNVEYAVRGLILQRSVEIARSGFADKSYTKLVPCHIGNPMALGMQALTYIRETVSLVANPGLLKMSDDKLAPLFALDNVQRARRYMQAIISPGAYTDSLGAEGLRREVCNFLERRDGFRPQPDTLMITNGASEGINTLLTCLIGGKNDGILLPVPQYPLYSAVITKLGGTVCPCYLDEEREWALTLPEIERAYEEAISKGITLKALVCISPGNPAPCFLNEKQIVDILTFCDLHGLLVIADEVYQENIYNPEKHPFVPFRRVLRQHKLATQLASVHSASKGFYGECGFRGGFTQLENIDPKSMAVVQKMRSIELCSNTLGQVVIACVTNPPVQGDPSFATFQAEKTATLAQLGLKADLVYRFFNSLTRTSCQPIHGALYAFPKIDFPTRAIAAARERALSVEQFYALELLESTGIIVSNGDGFGQREGTHHIRLAFLPQTEALKEGLESYRTFHESFMTKFI